jgi:hypothetical protein
MVEIVATAAESSDWTMRILFVVAFILQLSFFGSMDYIIILLRCLQIILHLPLLITTVTGNVSMMFGLIIPVVMFDILENDEFNYYSIF